MRPGRGGACVAASPVDVHGVVGSKPLRRPAAVEQMLGRYGLGVGPVMPPKPLSETAAEQVEADPFDYIFRIFNKR